MDFCPETYKKITKSVKSKTDLYFLVLAKFFCLKINFRAKINFTQVYLVADDVLRLFLILAARLTATDPSAWAWFELSVGVDGLVLTSKVSTFSTILGDSGSGVLHPDDREPPKLCLLNELYQP